MTAPNEATARQIKAARPGMSTWLSANAGSGKTRVLTDRVARLLLEGASPQNILCLTYTKAAASEMQNRLFKRLGAWAMTGDGPLENDLRDLGVEGTLDSARLAAARTLFARAIETPGGLKIQTIHSFCAGLLRRFPLEAGVTPQFTEMDERAAQLLTAGIVEEMADTLAPDVIDDVAQHYAAEDFSRLTGEIAKHRDRFFPALTPAMIRARFGLAANADADGLRAACLDGSEPALLDDLIPAMRAQTPSYAKFADRLATVDLSPITPDGFRTLCDLFLYKSGDRTHESKSANFPQSNHGKAREAFEPFLPELHAFMDRVADAQERLFALDAAAKSMALHRFAQTFLPLYEARKLARGWLDFDDLILRARDLMTDPAVANWVLYRLDGGIDHILVDEAQDTSPTQWRVIELLAQEFTSGQGARADMPRSLFVVGDMKQSIYSFQGADPQAFQRMFDHFNANVAETAPIVRLELQHSFRSSAAILRAVDATFSGPAGTVLDLGSTHRAFHDDLPGRVDLWPIVETQEDEDETDWENPVDRVSPNAAEVRLARMIAGEIRRMIDAGVTVPMHDGTRRKVSEGDFLILVQRRKQLFTEIITACKQQRLEIAGADRLKLGAELAVRDLRALLAFLVTPEDDLSLACALRSPLFGWSEQDLYRLAAGRGRTYLWTALRRVAADHPVTMKMLNGLRDDAGFLRPFDLIERILQRHGGRLRLLARLGPEAQDGLDELLNQALAYERIETPGLTGFLGWLDADDVEVKRQADTAGNRIRVMSVHGAKGLESPIVILPDTLRAQSDLQNQLFPSDDDTPLWRVPKEEMPGVLKASRARQIEADAAERARLLYVAMTRAETWLIVCGAGKQTAQTWYDAVETGLQDCTTVTEDFPGGPGRRLAHGDWAAGDICRADQTRADPVSLPGWIDMPAATVATETILNPSDLGGAKALPGEPDGADPGLSLERGTAIHLLLEHLPLHPRDTWPAVAETLLGGRLAASLLPEVRDILIRPELAHLFTPDTLAEVEIAATLDGRSISGSIDRLIVAPDAVLAIDFKSNAIVPDSAQTVPDGLLRQMGAYAHALGEIYPERRIDTAILWTRPAILMPLPQDLVKRALDRATAS